HRHEVIEHPQVEASGTVITTHHPIAGRLRQARAAARFSATPLPAPRGAPLLGQHTIEVLVEDLGLDQPTIDRLLAAGVIGAPEAETGPFEHHQTDSANETARLNEGA